MVALTVVSLTAAKVQTSCRVDAISTPQRTLTPQSSCTEFDTISSIASVHQEEGTEPTSQNIRAGDSVSRPLPAWLMQQSGHKKQAQGGEARAGNSLQSRRKMMMQGRVGDSAKIRRSQLRARGNAVLASVRESADPTGNSVGPAEQAVPLTKLCGARAKCTQKTTDSFQGAGSRSPPGWSHLAVNQIGVRAPSGVKDIFSWGAACGEPDHTCGAAPSERRSQNAFPMTVEVASLASSSLSCFMATNEQGSLPAGLGYPLRL